MTADDHTALARVIHYWLDEMPITIAQVVENGGPGRSTIDAILAGRTRRPSFATLRKLAINMTTHPKRKTREASVTTRCLTELCQAAGYGNIAAEQGAQLLEDAVMMLVGDVTLMRVWVTFITERRALSLAELLAAIGRFDARPGEPLTTERAIE